MSRIPLVNRMERIVLLTVAALLVAGCQVGPNYARPAVDTPTSYRLALAPDATASVDEPSIADEQWLTIFQDPVLQNLVKDGLANNLDLRIAAQRVLQAQAQTGIARSRQLPSLSVGANYSALKTARSPVSDNSVNSGPAAFADGGGPTALAAWNLDFWGLYRRQSEAARAEVLASEWGQRAVRISLIEHIADAYFNLRSLDAQKNITENTIAARKDSLRLTQSLDQYGAGSLADVRQAEELLATAQANLPELRRQIAAQENALSILLGHNPGAIERGLPIEQQPHPQQVPVAVPSALLERRPDIRQAEATLIAANARVGVARARYFPQITLTGLGGAASSQLNAILNGSNAYWYAAGSITEPIFDGGLIRSNYRLSQARRQEMVLAYQKTILTAFKSVSDSLVAYKERHEQREQESVRVVSAADAVRLARLRYAGGNTSYLEVLTTDTNLYDAQLLLAQAQQQEAASLIELYTSLGGGWQQ